MEPSIVSAVAALFGSIVGGSATVATPWITQRTQGRRELVIAEIRGRVHLYTEFIAECFKLNLDSLDHTLDQPQNLVHVHALVNRIRFLSSGPVRGEAEAAVARILSQYANRNLTNDEIQKLGLSDYDDPLRPFGEACRLELRKLLHSA